MSFFKHCGLCGKNKLYITTRQYLVPKVSPKPITSKSEMCGECFRKLKNITNNINEQR